MNARNLLGSVTGLRTMVIAVCAITNIYFLSIFAYPFDWPTAHVLDESQFQCSVLMVVLFLMLRFALANLTAARAEDLDEFQLKMRDDAYRLGYIVVRRVGLGVFLALVVLTPLTESFVYGGYDASSKDFHFQSQPLRDFLIRWLQGPHLLDFAARLFFVLAFTAYCFPIVVLAWRNAAFQASLSGDDRLALARPVASASSDDLQIRATASEIQLRVSQFRKQLALVAIAWPLFIAAAVALAQTKSFIGTASFEIFGPIAFGLMSFTLWTLFAGMFKQQFLIKKTKDLVRASRVSGVTYRWVVTLSLATGVFSIALPALFYAAPTFKTLPLTLGWYAGLIFSIATLVSQTATFIIAGNAAKRIIAEELAKVDVSASS